MVTCPACGAENEDAAEVCFHCRAVLSAVTRGTLVASRYRILAPLGRGGMGAVYRAKDEVLDEEVALKILRPEVAGTPEMAARFRSEIKLARKVSHWNVCRIHEYGEDGALQYISMELITGGTLKDLLVDGPLPPADAFEVAGQVAEGLAAIHKVGIIHRDLKSANVMIAADGTAKVMDFGIAKAAAAGTDAGSTGYVLGSPEYMSPEQARGRRADFRSDLYSLGVVVFEAFTGHVPFRGPTPVATLMMHVEAPPPVDDPAVPLPDALRPILRRALAKEAAERFADAEGMAAALRAARAGAGPLPAAAAAGSLASPTRRLRAVARSPRVPLVAVALAAGIAALAVGAAVILRERAARPAAAEAPSTVVPVPAPGPPQPSAALAPTGLPPARAAPPPTRGPVARLTAPPPLAAAPATVPSAPPSATAPSPEPATPPPTASASERTMASPSVTPPAATEGWLLVIAVPWAEVTVDGRPAGMTPMEKVSLAPGPHAVVLTHPDYQPFRRKVSIEAGQTRQLKVDFGQDGVRKRR